MNDISFYKSFGLNVYSFRTYRHTDNSQGIDCHYLAKMTSGRAKFASLSGEVLEVAEGDVFYLPSGLRYHSYWYGDGEDGSFGWISVSLGFMPHESGAERKMQKLAADESEHRMIDEIVAAGLPSPEGIGILYTLLARLLPRMSYADGKDDRRLSEIKRYMRENPRLRIPELAKKCGMSESSIYAFVKRETGKTPVTLHNRIKARAAEELLLSTDMTVEEIAYRSGFESAAYFRKIFKAAIGKTPAEVKRARRLI